MIAKPTVNNGAAHCVAETRWQWMDNHFGAMGWFDDAAKRLYENQPGFTDGHWRLVPAEEVAEFYRVIARLAYEQS